MTVQTGPDRGTVLRSGLKIWDRTADKSVQSGPVPVPRSGPVSLAVTEPVEVRLVAVELTEAELVESPAEIRPAERLAGVAEAVRRVEVVGLVEER